MPEYSTPHPRHLGSSEAEDALRQSEERFAKAFLSSPVPMVISTWEEGRFIETNDSFLAMSGYRREELAGRTSRETGFWPNPDDRRKLLDMLTQSETAVRRAAHPIHTKSGGECLVDLAVEQIALDGQRCLLYIFHDVTDRIRAEQDLQLARAELEVRVEERTRELREQRDFAERLIDTAPMIVLVLDQSRCYVRFNRYMQEVSGFSLEEVRGLLALSVGLPAEEWPVAEEVLARVLKGETVRGQVLESVTKDGRRVHFEWHFTPLRDIGNGSPGILAIGQDITERRRAEAALRKSEQLRLTAEKLAATGRLAAAVAHEINNPLAGIQNSFLLIKDAIPADHPHFCFVGRIEREVERIAQIVRRMYALHRPRQEQICDVSVAETVRDVVAMLAPRADRQEVRMEVSVDGCGPIARVPEGALRQILYNLAANAIDASPRGGGVKIDAAVAGGALHVAVSDQGGGIPDEMRDRIFEPFFSTKGGDAAGGMGLGLAVCRELVQSQRGSLTFDSQPGKETVFRAVLPLHAQ